MYGFRVMNKKTYVLHRGQKCIAGSQEDRRYLSTLSNGPFSKSQASPAGRTEDQICEPGFDSESVIFKVTEKHLRPTTIVGKVNFTDCTDVTRLIFTTYDSHFYVETDGTVTVSRWLVLQEGQRRFYIHSWDSKGKKRTVSVVVQYQGDHDAAHSIQSDFPLKDITNNLEDAPQVPILYFPKSNPGLKRRKRGWVVPPLNVAENHRGPYPLALARIRSDIDKVKKIYYKITGPGANEFPVGLFTMDRDSGHLYVTQDLDREKVDKYMLFAHAEAAGGVTNVEEPMEIIINVIDQNDNKPVFNQSTYKGEVPEASTKGFDVIQVVATDADEPNTDNSDIRYRIMSQKPEDPSPNMFTINPATGAIRVNEAGLDREKVPKYELEVMVADMKGEGLAGFTKVIIRVTDSNDHAPVFTESRYEATVEENKVDALVVKMLVKDGDEPHTMAWNAKFSIIDGDPGNLFTVETGTNKQEGIISTAKGLDFERTSKHTLLVTVENEAPFAVPLVTSTATVVVTVEDVNEPPIFDPKEKHVSKREDLAENSTVVRYTATDPDVGRKQKVMYKILDDPAGWLVIDKGTGEIKVRNQMDREDNAVKENKYTALIGGYDDDDQIPATGTGTLIITLEDVNDNPPSVDDRLVKMCNKKPVPQLLSVTDKDGPGFTFPYSVTLQDSAKTNWTARMNDNKTGIVLTLTRELESGTYKVGMKVSDNQGLFQLNTIEAEVCDCTGEEVRCIEKVIAGSSMPVILGILGGVLLLLMLVLLLLLLANKNKPKKGQPLLLDNDIRDDIFCYDEEGGGEEDQDYFDLGVLHRGLDNRPHVFRDEVAPVFQTRPVVYKPRPANPEDIGGFIDDNLKAADNDPTAPPYDSLLVFDYEGGGSEAGSISSLNSSSDGDQDYDCLSDWGPRFKKLADMYGGGDDDMM
ncbi:B-cadherin-like isoform X2 [Xiphophorus couchianus]|uniref:B-cadherin-like isoform X2 n=1 Tax=Xiphophorus couchianus TaxID=32473 RepID=UPI00101641A2|nr:B-cadherin-like isoform X2 [Xiphophorus couchianus]